jgi:protein disulfide-isomerase A6
MNGFTTLCVVAVVTIALSASPAAALYSSSDDVVELTSANFKDLVVNRPGNWMVEFYAPWCGHCRQLSPAYKKLATNLKGVAYVGAVNCDDHKSLCNEHGIRGFPTLKAFTGEGRANPYRKGERMKDPEDYQMQRSPGAMARFLTSRLPNNVKTLTDATVADFLAAEGPPKALLFSAKKTTTELAKGIALNLKGRMSLGQVHESEKETVKKYGITKFPAVLVFKTGAADDKPIPFEGKLSAVTLAAFMEKNAGPMPKEWGSAKAGSGTGSKSGKQQQQQQGHHNADSAPIEDLSATSFDKKVVEDKNHVWLVAFVAPWCGHCKRMKPDWDALMEEYSTSNSVVVAEVDCTEQEGVCGKFGVQGYPTIKYFVAGNPEPQDYQQGRDMDSLRSFVVDNLEKLCQVADPTDCSEREVKFINVMQAKTEADRAAQVTRLEGMKSSPMKPELKKWISQRLNILNQM